MRLLVFLLCLQLSSVYAQDIHIPMVPVLEQPDTPPSPPDSPIAVSTLRADEWYIVTSDTPLFLLHSPDKHVAVSEETGPMKFRGKFADGIGKTETRTYSEKHIYVVEAVKEGSIELLIVPVGVTKQDAILRQTLLISGVGPIPPPVPIPTDGKRVLIVYESSELSSLPASQSVLMSSAVVRDYLQSHCSKGPDGSTPEFRIWDQNVDLTNVPKVWKDAMALPRSSIPWVVISNGVQGYAGPLPKTEAELLTVMKKYLGE